MKTAEIIYGSNLGNKEALIFGEMKNIIDGGGKVLYIVPEQYAFNADKTVLFKLGEKYSHLTETINFKRMASLVNERINPTKRDYITEEIKNLILYKIYLENAGRFKTLSRRGSSPDTVILFRDILTELKTNLITSEDLENVLSSIPDESLLYGKIWDLKLIFEEYTRYTEESYRDFDDSFLKLAENIKKYGLYKDYHIFIDNFIHLSKSEYLVVTALFENAASVHAALLLDNLTGHEEGDLFFLTENTAELLMKAAEKADMKVSCTCCDKEYKKLLVDIFEAQNGNDSEGIVMTDAKTRTDEVRHVLLKIKELIAEGASFNDIAVFSGDISVYEDIIASLFSDGEIPYFDDRKIPASENPVCRLLISAFSFYMSGYRLEEMLCYLKSLLFLFDISEGVCLFETVVSCFHPEQDCIKNREKWNTALDTALKGNSYLLSKKGLINSVYEKFILPVVESFSPLKKKNESSVYTECFSKFINKIRLEEHLRRFAERPENTEIANGAVSAYNMLLKAIKNIEKINKSEEIQKENWLELLKQSAGVYKTGILPNLIDCVTVSDTQRGRTGSKKYIFIMGLNDGITPKTNENSGFLTDADRKIIEEATGTVLPTVLWKNNSSLLSFYRTCTLAENMLFISKSKFSDEGAELTPSFMWGRFLDKVHLAEEFECDYVNIKEAAQRIISVGAEKDDPLYNRVLESKGCLMTDMERMCEENYFDVKKRVSKELLNSRYQKKLNTSVSRLETYRKCGYSYFLRYLLKINEPENAEYDFAKTGTLVHDIIDIFSKKMASDGKEWAEVTEDYAEEAVKSAAYYEINEKFPKMNMFNPRTKYLVSKLSRTAKTAIMYIKEHFVSGSFVPLGYEIPVGNDGIKPLTAALSDGSVVEIYGRIDRADGYFDKDGNTLYVRIIDYKSSAKSIDFSMVKEGIQLQLLTYLASVVKNGGEYLDFAGEILPGAALYMAFDHSMTCLLYTSPSPRDRG